MKKLIFFLAFIIIGHVLIATAVSGCTLEKQCTLGCADEDLILPPNVYQRPTKETKDALTNPR